MKKSFKNLIPTPLYTVARTSYIFIKKLKIRQYFKKTYSLDMKRYLTYSRTMGLDTSDKMIASIVLQYHVIEKGLTMPDSRLGFGKERIIALCKSCLEYVHAYGSDDMQLRHAIGVILEYEDFHKSNNFSLSEEVQIAIGKIKSLTTTGLEKTEQKTVSDLSYFQFVNSPFPEFAASRFSVRNYSDVDIPLTAIQSALELARNTPSACNRQCWRTYVFDDKKKMFDILEAQGGNRGFGHLANKLIVIAGEIGAFSYTNERNQVFIDGGIYAMNLLYALHYQKIATCIMNCSFDYDKEQRIKAMCGVKESEVLIAMIACGYPVQEFKIANSPRYPISKTNSPSF